MRRSRGHSGPSVKWGEIIGPVGTRLCEAPLKAPGRRSSTYSEGLVPVFPIAKAPGPADTSGGVWESRGGRTCEPLGRLPGRACKMAAAVGRGQQVGPASGDMGPLGGGGWHPALLCLCCTHRTTRVDRRRLALYNARRK